MEVDLGGGKVNMIEIWNFDWSQRINKISKSKSKTLLWQITFIGLHVLVIHGF